MAFDCRLFNDSRFKELDFYGRAILIYLGVRRNEKTLLCNPSWEAIQQDLRVSRNTINDKLWILEDKGLIKRTPGHGPKNSTRFEIVEPGGTIPGEKRKRVGGPRHAEIVPRDMHYLANVNSTSAGPEIVPPGGTLTIRTFSEESCTQKKSDRPEPATAPAAPAAFDNNWVYFTMRVGYLGNGKKDMSLLPKGWNSPDFVLPEREPSHNCVVLLPGRSGLLVVDVDRKGGIDGLKSLRDFGVDLLGICGGPICETPSGGYHFYFLAPVGLTHTTRANLLPGVDARGIGGAVIMPPTEIPGYGRYKWLNSPERSALGTLPEKLLALFAEPKQPLLAPAAPGEFGALTLDKLSPDQRAEFDRRLHESATRPPGPGNKRSEADFSLCWWAVSCGLSPDVLWSKCGAIGKFKESGREYFERTYRKAQQEVGR